MLSIFLDPNIAYLFLVSFFFLAGIAILSPGTGLLEVGALLALIGAGWAIYNLPFNLWALLILVLGVFPPVIAARITNRTFFLWISVACLVLGTVFVFRGNRWWQPAVNLWLAAFSSLGAGGLYYLVSLRTLEAVSSPPSHDLDRLIGSLGEARSNFSGEMEGSVQVQGELWSARSSQKVEKGQTIRVVDRVGFLLVVDPVPDA